MLDLHPTSSNIRCKQSFCGNSTTSPVSPHSRLGPMQEIFHFLNQGWVGTVIGIAGVVVGLMGLYLYRSSRVSGIIAFQSDDMSLIGDKTSIFPAGAEVQYRGTPVPRITSSIVWIWNAGKKTVRGSDIVERDPLQLRFGGEVLNVRTRTVSREVVKFAVAVPADSSKEARKNVCVDFEFLDPDDGGVIEVLHTGSDEMPQFTGTIVGLPKGPQHWGSSTPHDPARWLKWLMVFLLLPLGLALLMEPHLAEDPEVYVPFRIRAPFGLLIWSLALLLMWRLRRRAPSSLYRRRMKVAP